MKPYCCYPGCEDEPVWAVATENPEDIYDGTHACPSHLGELLDERYTHVVWALPETTDDQAE